MSQPGDEVEQDLSHIHWSWPEAVAANPARSLATADLAMDYFAYSPFWDTKSNNNVLRTQRRVENPTYGHAEEKVELYAFTTGFEYIVAHSQPPELFVIHRREVDPSGKRDRVSGAWFILHEKVYQCPTLFDVVSTRLKNAAALVSKTLNSLSERRPPANPRATTTWRALPPSTADPIPSPTVQPASAEPSTADADPSAPADDAPSAKAPTKSNNTPSQPDWHLFHALQSTRASLASISERSHAPLVPPDPLAELRALEAQLASQFAQPQAPAQSGRAGPSAASRPGSLRSASLMGLAPPSVSAGRAGAGLTPAVTLSAGVASPARLGGGGMQSPASMGGRALSVGIGASPMAFDGGGGG